MASEEVEALRAELVELRTEMRASFERMTKAVESLASRAYIPGPSVWKRIGAWVGLVRLG
jgi:hypothetical protein